MELPETITELPAPFTINVIDTLKDRGINSLKELDFNEAQDIIVQVNTLGNSFSDRTKVYMGTSELDGETNYLLLDYSTQEITIITANQLK